MTEGKASRSSSGLLQLLVVGMGEQAGVFEEFVHTHAKLTEICVDRSADFESAQVKLAEQVYDLVLFAQDEPETPTARMIQELQLQGKRMPLLFLPATLRHNGRTEPGGEVRRVQVSRR